MDEKYMHLALKLAEQARGRTSPNPMVGAVIVKDGKIVGRGYHQKAGTPHAEVHALREAGEKAKGAKLYVTLEPCSHFGRTPPCSQAVIKAGLAEVYVAIKDPNPLVAGRGIKQLLDAGIKVHVGLLEEEARKLNEIFIKYITTRKPFVLLKYAMTLDGKIASRTGHSKWITDTPAREIVHRLRDEYNAILVGVNTVLNDDPALTCRLPEGGHDPARIILDSSVRTPLNAKILNLESSAKTYIAVTSAAPEEKIAALEAKGTQIIKLSSNPHGRVNLNELLDKLGQMELTSLLIEGGSQVAASFIEASLVDKVIAFIAPKLIGGTQSPGPVGGMGFNTMDQAIKLIHTKVDKIGEDFFIEGYPK